MQPIETRKIQDFFFLLIRKATASDSRNKTMAISTHNTKCETPTLDHIEEARRMSFGRYGVTMNMPTV